MDLEARMEWLEAEVRALRGRVGALTEGGSPVAPPAQPGPLLAQQIRRLSLDPEGREQPMLLQAVLDRPGSVTISFASLQELRESVDAPAILRLASTLASEPRLKILQALTTGERSAAELADAAGLEGGPLYHHLSGLMDAGFLRQRSRGRYAMTNRGRDLYYHAAMLVRTPYDSTEQG